MNEHSNNKKNKTNKTTLVLGSIFIALVLFYLLASINPPEISRGARPLFEDMVTNISRIEVDYPNQQDMTIEQRADGWYITEPYEYKASDRMLQQTLDELVNIDVDGIVSTNQTSHDEFNVSDSLGTHFTVYDEEDVLLDVIIGGRTVDATHTYARYADSDDVMLWRGLFGHRLKIKVDQWRDKTIYNYNAEDIVSVTVTEGAEVRTLAQEGDGYTYTIDGNSIPVNIDGINIALGVLSTLQADALADERDIERVVMNEPDMHITFRVRNGDVNEFDLWRPDEVEGERYLVREEGGEVVYRFYRGIGEKILFEPGLIAQ